MLSRPSLVDSFDSREFGYMRGNKNESESVYVNEDRFWSEFLGFGFLIKFILIDNC